MEINLEKLAFDLDFHPSENLVPAALVNGNLLLLFFILNSLLTDSFLIPVLEVHAHTESRRAVCFIDDGCAIVAGSLDCSILATDVETGGTIARLEDAHGEAINKIINLYQSKIAFGDDGGCIKVRDTRQCYCCGTYQAHEDYVSDMTFKVQARFEFSEEELLFIFLVKVAFFPSGVDRCPSKVVCLWSTRPVGCDPCRWMKYGIWPKQFVPHSLSLGVLILDSTCELKCFKAGTVHDVMLVRANAKLTGELDTAKEDLAKERADNSGLREDLPAPASLVFWNTQRSTSLLF
ncbi:hypothetical protein UlMin_026732 [Ulmus minor]